MISEFRHLEIAVDHYYAREAVDAVLNHRVDFALAVNPIPHQELIISHLYTTYIAVWTSQKTERMNPDVLLYDPHMYAIEHILAPMQHSKWTFDRSLLLSSLETIANLVGAGAGRGILPADAVCANQANHLRIFWEPKTMPAFDVALVYRRDMIKTDLSRRVILSIEAALKQIVPAKMHFKSR